MTGRRRRESRRAGRRRYESSEADAAMTEDVPASPAATNSLTKRGTPQVRPARFDGVSPQFFGAQNESGTVAFALSLRKTKD